MALRFPALLTIDFETGWLRRYERFSADSARETHRCQVDAPKLRELIDEGDAENLRKIMPMDTALQIVPADPEPWPPGYTPLGAA